jgi:hypothetical protein
MLTQTTTPADAQGDTHTRPRLDPRLVGSSFGDVLRLG